jgi:hypothetical protein
MANLELPIVDLMGAPASTCMEPYVPFMIVR